MLIPTRGIVFHATKYSETSLVCKIFTEKLGLQSYMINGVRKQKGKFALLQPLMLLDMIVYNREQKNLQRVKEFQLSHNYSDLPFNTVKSSVGIFLLEVLQKCVKAETADEPLFNFIYENLVALDEMKEGAAEFHLHFLTKLSAFLGFEIHGNYSAENHAYRQAGNFFDLQHGTFTNTKPTHVEFAEGKTAENISALIHSQKENVLLFNYTERKKILEVLLSFYKLHIENFTQIRSLKILEEVLKP